MDSQLSGYKVRVENAGVQTQVYDHALTADDVTQPQTISVNMPGDTVTITRGATALTLCEVQVFGGTCYTNMSFISDVVV